jgi:ATP-dependent exoDNAse (exonuclease V) alpha subunit
MMDGCVAGTHTLCQAGWLLRHALRILSAKGERLLLCAPTGRAAKRMDEATDLEGKTIHRLLEVDPKVGGFRRNDANPRQLGSPVPR